MAPVIRGWFGALLDWFATWSWELSPERCTYSIESQRIPIEDDGLELAADLYRPQITKTAGTILVMSPYGIGTMIALGAARIFAARGYQVLMTSCRGTGASGGEHHPGRHEAADGQAVVSWMKKQPWYTGSFATLGGSFLGYTQWAILSNQPDDMKTAIIAVGPHDISSYLWGSGALNTDFVRWADAMNYIKSGGRLPLPLHLVFARGQFRQDMTAVPQLDGINKFLNHTPPTWFQGWVTHPDVSDPFWEDAQHGDALERVDIPVLLIGGWYDFMLGQLLEQYHRLANRGCPVALTLGPWSHLETQPSSVVKNLHLAWLEEHLGDHTASSRKQPVHLYVTGANEWRHLPRWPPATQSYNFYLNPNDKLSEEKAIADTSASTFTFDPADPTPTIGTSTFDQMDAGKEDDSSLAKRHDVVTFTMAPLDRDIEVCGKPSVKLYHSSIHHHADLLIRLSDVAPGGRGQSQNISETYLRLQPTTEPTTNTDPKLLQIDLLDCAHRFRKGSRIRVTIAGGSSPRYLPNLGPGGIATASNVEPVTHFIHHSAVAPSVIILPVNNES